MNNQFSYKHFFSWKFCISISISIIFSFYAFKKFDPVRFLHILESVNYLYIFLAMLLLIFVVYIRALRWSLLFDDKKIPIKKLFESQLIGYFGNNIFPLRLGEGLRCFFLSKYSNLGAAQILGTIILERLLDMFALILLGVILFLTNSSFIKNYDNKYFLGSIFIIVLIMLLFSFYFNRTSKKYNSDNNFFKIINNILIGFQSLSRKNIFSILLYTLLIWSIYLIEVFLIQNSISLNLGLVDCVLILFISSLALSIPSSPGNIGTFEAGVIYAMGIIGISVYQLEFALILHAVTFFPYTILGGMLFVYHNYYLINYKND